MTKLNLLHKKYVCGNNKVMQAKPNASSASASKIEVKESRFSLRFFKSCSNSFNMALYTKSAHVLCPISQSNLSPLSSLPIPFPLSWKNLAIYAVLVRWTSKGLLCMVPASPVLALHPVLSTLPSCPSCRRKLTVSQFRTSSVHDNVMETRCINSSNILMFCSHSHAITQT